jgi:putative addiction module killer protein
MNSSFEIREYAENGRSPYGDWFEGLDDVTALRVQRDLRRLEAGNFGSVKVLQQGVFEVRMDFGPGYRVYFGRHDHTIIVLLGGGSKRRQDADIAAAIERWSRYKQTRT